MISKKGQITFSSAPSYIITIVLMVLIGAAGVIALAAMKLSNAAYTEQATNTSVLNTTVNQGITGLGNVSTQYGTVGTMLGVALVLVVILGVFGGFAGRRGGL